MDKIKTREKVILAIAGLAIVYAGYVYLIEPAFTKAKTNEQKQEISAPVSTVKNDLVKDAETGMDKYIIARAETDWKKNPFLDRNSSSYKQWASIQRAASGSGSAKMIYSGYVDSGKMKIAIIDGFGYQAGEELETEGYVLKQVTTSQVVILNKNTGIEVEVPLQE